MLLVAIFADWALWAKLRVANRSENDLRANSHMYVKQRVVQEDVRAPGVFATCSSHHVNYVQRVITGGACRTAAHRNSHVHTSADEENEIVERARCKGRKQTLAGGATSSAPCMHQKIKLTHKRHLQRMGASVSQKQLQLNAQFHTGRLLSLVCAVIKQLRFWKSCRKINKYINFLIYDYNKRSIMKMCEVKSQLKNSKCVENVFVKILMESICFK